MDSRAEVREFLRSRRARLSPSMMGLPVEGVRRVPGLRRGEIARLAGVSVEYYSKLERGDIGGASPSVLDAVARALQLDDAERTHLSHLAQAAGGTSSTLRPQRRSRAVWTPTDNMQLILDAITGGPAIIRNGRMELLAVNLLGRSLHSAMYDSPVHLGGLARPPSFARYTFLDVESRQFYADWETAADICVAILRAEAGRDPRDRGLQDVVGELSTLSNEFSRRWSSHEVRPRGSWSGHFHHHVVGAIHLVYESFEVVLEAGLTLVVYAASPGTATADALKELGKQIGTNNESLPGI